MASWAEVTMGGPHVVIGAVQNTLSSQIPVPWGHKACNSLSSLVADHCASEFFYLYSVCTQTNLFPLILSLCNDFRSEYIDCSLWADRTIVLAMANVPHISIQGLSHWISCAFLHYIWWYSDILLSSIHRHYSLVSLSSCTAVMTHLCLSLHKLVTTWYAVKNV